MTSIQEVSGKHMMVKGVDVSKTMLDDMLEQLYLEHRFCPTFVLLSTQVRKDGYTDYHHVYQHVLDYSPLSGRYLQEQVNPMSEISVLFYVNQTTGFLTPIYGHRYLPSRTMIFGSYEAENVVFRPPAYSRIWGQQLEGDGA